MAPSSKKTTKPKSKAVTKVSAPARKPAASKATAAKAPVKKAAAAKPAAKAGTAPKVSAPAAGKPVVFLKPISAKPAQDSLWVRNFKEFASENPAMTVVGIVAVTLALILLLG